MQFITVERNLMHRKKKVRQRVYENPKIFTELDLCRSLTVQEQWKSERCGATETMFSGFSVQD